MRELTTAELAAALGTTTKRISDRAGVRGIEPLRIVGRTAYWPLRAKAFLAAVPRGRPGQDAVAKIRAAWADGRNRP